MITLGFYHVRSQTQHGVIPSAAAVDHIITGSVVWRKPNQPAESVYLQRAPDYFVNILTFDRVPPNARLYTHRTLSSNDYLAVLRIFRCCGNVTFHFYITG